MFARMLVAVTTDEIDDAVVATAIGLAQPLGANVALLHVISSAEMLAPIIASTEPTGMGMPTLTPANIQLTEELLENQQREGLSFVHTLAKRFPEGVSVEPLLREGAAEEAIIAAAKEWQADLIILGTHGRRGLERLVLGSTAEAVLRTASCPVLTIRAGMHAE